MRVDFFVLFFNETRYHKYVFIGYRASSIHIIIIKIIRIRFFPLKLA